MDIITHAFYSFSRYQITKLLYLWVDQNGEQLVTTSVINTDYNENKTGQQLLHDNKLSKNLEMDTIYLGKVVTFVKIIKNEIIPLETWEVYQESSLEINPKNE